MRVRYNFLIVPLVTFALTVAHYLVASLFPQFGASLIGPFLGFILICIMFGDPICSLVGALIFSLYAHVESGYDSWRIVQVVVFSVIGALSSVAVRRSLIRWHDEAIRNRHAVDLINAANGNLGKLKEIHLDAKNLIQWWDGLSEAARFEMAKNILGNLAHVLTVWEGWHALFQEKEIMKWENLRQKLGGKDGD